MHCANNKPANKFRFTVMQKFTTVKGGIICQYYTHKNGLMFGSVVWFLCGDCGIQLGWFPVLTGIAGETLTDNPDLYISRDGGITWEETLAGSWGVNVADHGGLIVAARDYHQEMSSELMYSCNEGYTWTSFRFSTVRGYVKLCKSYHCTVYICIHALRAIREPLSAFPPRERTVLVCSKNITAEYIMHSCNEGYTWTSFQTCMYR